MNGQSKWNSRRLVAYLFAGAVLVLFAYWKTDAQYALAWAGIVATFIGGQSWIDGRKPEQH